MRGASVKLFERLRAVRHWCAFTESAGFFFFLQQSMIKDTRLRVFLTNVQTAMLRHRDSIKQTTDAQPLLTSLLYTWGYAHTHSELHWHDK